MDIKNSPSGKVITALAGYKAYIPNRLPPDFEWTTSLVNSLSRADHALGMLAREGSRLLNPHLLMRPFIVREAVLSSKIEGIQATLGDILANDAGIAIGRNADDLQEVQNYINALDYGITRLQDFPLSLRVIKEIHEKLMSGVRGDHATPGEFRRSQNWIGAPGSTLNNAKYIPPSPEHLMQTLGEFESFLHDRSLPPLIHIALCHYQFEAIHPFLDGNGRVGRLLITLLLLERKVLPSPLLYISAFFEATRSEYYQYLFEVSSKGNWREWIAYFLNGVAIQSLDVLSRAERINKLLEDWLVKIDAPSGAVAAIIVKNLAVNPYITTTKIAKDMNVAYTTAQRAIQKLEQLSIVKQAFEGKRERVYCAVEILAILEEQTKITQMLDGSLQS